jgi:fructose-specific phosphotransferase system IIC component
VYLDKKSRLSKEMKSMLSSLISPLCSSLGAIPFFGSIFAQVCTTIVQFLQSLNL